MDKMIKSQEITKKQKEEEKEEVKVEYAKINVNLVSPMNNQHLTKYLEMIIPYLIKRKKLKQLKKLDF